MFRYSCYDYIMLWKTYYMQILYPSHFLSVSPLLYKAMYL